MKISPRPRNFNPGAAGQIDKCWLQFWTKNKLKNAQNAKKTKTKYKIV